MISMSSSSVPTLPRICGFSHLFSLANSFQEYPDFHRISPPSPHCLVQGADSILTSQPRPADPAPAHSPHPQQPRRLLSKMQIQPHLPQLRTLLRIPQQPPHSPSLFLQPYFRPQTLQPPVFSKLAPTSGASQLLSPVAGTRSPRSSRGSFSSTPCTLMDATPSPHHCRKAPLHAKDHSASSPLPDLLVFTDETVVCTHWLGYHMSPPLK